MKRRPAPTAALDGVDAAGLADELTCQREVEETYRTDELARRRGRARHERDLADLDADTRHAELERAEREAQARADADLARMYREFRAAGERTRVTSQMARSGEARALRLERLRGLNLRVLVPVLCGFAAWSTTGVHDGAARLMGITDWHAATWGALWLLEPVLIGAVVWILIVRARLASAGGRISTAAESIAYGCLSTSVLLNLSAAAHTVHGPHKVAQLCAVLAAMLAHAIGPVGAAATAHLIGIVDESIAAADPWTEDGRPVPLLADLEFALAGATVRREAPIDAEFVETRPTLWPLSLDGRGLLPIVSAAEEAIPADAVESAIERAETWPLPIEDRVLLPIVSALDSAVESASVVEVDSAVESASVTVWPLPSTGRTLLPVVAKSAPSSASKSASETSRNATEQARRTHDDQRGQRSSTAARTVRPNKGAKVPAAALKSAAEVPSRALSDEELRKRLEALIASGTLPAHPSKRQVQGALGIGFKRVDRVHSTPPARSRTRPMGRGR